MASSSKASLAWYISSSNWVILLILSAFSSSSKEEMPLLLLEMVLDLLPRLSIACREGVTGRFPEPAEYENVLVNHTYLNHQNHKPASRTEYLREELEEDSAERDPVNKVKLGLQLAHYFYYPQMKQKYIYIVKIPGTAGGPDPSTSFSCKITSVTLSTVMSIGFSTKRLLLESTLYTGAFLLTRSIFIPLKKK